MLEGHSVLITILKDKEHSENRFRRINVRNLISLKDINKQSLVNIAFEIKKKEDLKKISPFINERGSTSVKIKIKDYDKIAVFELKDKRKINNEILKKLKKEGFLPIIQ